MSKPFSMRQRLIDNGIVEPDAQKRALTTAFRLKQAFPSLDLSRYNPRHPMEQISDA